MRDESKKYKVFTRRALILSGIKLTLFGILGGRFCYLQFIESEKYQNIATRNCIKIIIVPVPRGIIVDRNGIELASNQTSYQLILDKSGLSNEMIEKSIEYAESLLGYKTRISQTGIIKSLKEHSSTSNILIVQNNLSWSDVTKIEVSNDTSFLSIQHNQRRFYLNGTLFCHVLGYIAQADQQELTNLNIPKYTNIQIGKNGIEKTQDLKLQGTPGIKKIEINAFGKFVREINHIDGIPASKMVLSIDYKIQQILAESLEGKIGSITIMNPKDGKVLGMYSSPSYDTNRFIGGITYENWKKLVDNPDKPLINKAISTLYPAGSTFKLVTGLALLESGINPYDTVLCTGSQTIKDRVLHCWNRNGHGLVNLQSAISKSCNIYFYTKSLLAGISKIAKTAKVLGLGDITGIELPFEQRGLVPDKDWKKNRFKKEWSVGDTINVSIGQGYILVTPIQLATMMSRIVSGFNIKPTLLENSATEPILSTLSIDSKYLELVKDGLYNAFYDTEGNSYNHRLLLPDFEMVGKTGTAQIVSLKHKENKNILIQDHGLFIGFAPFRNPRYVISVVIEHGGWGSKSALPVAKNVMERLAEIYG